MPGVAATLEGSSHGVTPGVLAISSLRAGVRLPWLAPHAGVRDPDDVHAGVREPEAPQAGVLDPEAPQAGVLDPEDVHAGVLLDID